MQGSSLIPFVGSFFFGCCLHSVEPPHPGFPLDSMPSSPSSDSCSSFEDDLWEVQEILAQRHTLSGETEYLVVWRCTWTPASLVKAGPELRRWQAASKFKTKEPMAVTLPVLPGTQLHKDCRRIALQRAAQHAVLHPRVLGASPAINVVPSPVLTPSHSSGSRLHQDSAAKRGRRD